MLRNHLPEPVLKRLRRCHVHYRTRFHFPEYTSQRVYLFGLICHRAISGQVEHLFFRNGAAFTEQRHVNISTAWS